MRILKPFGLAIVRWIGAPGHVVISLGTVLLLVSSPALCQEDLGPPSGIVAALRSGKEETQSTLVRLLGLRHLAPGQNLSNCDIRADAASLDERGNTFLLQIQCANDVHVVALRNHGGLSEVLASRNFYAAPRCRMEFATLIRRSLQQIVIHNVATSPGAGEPSYFLLLQLSDKGLKVLFSALETNVVPRRTQMYTQESTFSLVPASEAEIGSIDEHATVRDGESAYSIRRSFRWSADLETFVEVEVPKVKSGR